MVMYAIVLACTFIVYRARPCLSHCKKLGEEHREKQDRPPNLRDRVYIAQQTINYY